MVRLGPPALLRALRRRRGPTALVSVARNLVVEQSSDTVAILDQRGCLIDVNTAGDLLIRRLVPDAPDRLIGVHTRTLLADWLPEEGVTDGEYELTIDDLEVVFDVRATELADRRGRRLGQVYVVRDVTDVAERRKELAEATIRLVEEEELVKRLRTELVDQANHDPLTGLHNRRFLVERMTEEIERAEFDGGLSVVMIDIDSFHSVNEAHGHAVGDDLLAAIAKGLSETVRSRDVLARYGGVEFALVLPGADSEQACARAEQLRLRCGAITIQTANGPISRTVSAGVASFPSAGTTPSALLAAADQALYVAKASGRDRVSVAERIHVVGR